ncbi:MAG: hypothetical protein ABIW32_00480 [Terrimesophilobacter sp.]
MIEIPRWDALPGDAARCLTRVDEWGLRLRDSAVLAEFSEPVARRVTGLHGAELFDALDQFAADHWDFRGGRERNLARTPGFTTAQSSGLEAAAEELGLMGTLPPRQKHYDAVIMTGGMVRAGIVKPRYLRELSERGLQWNEGIFLGGFRQFGGDETLLAPRLGVDGDNEFDAMTAGMRQAFGLGAPPSTHGFNSATGNEPQPSDWREDSWIWRGRTLRVIAAPSSEPERRRANTVDTYRFWAARAKGIRSVLILTTPIYVPYQGAGAIEVLGAECGFSIETVAVSAAASDLGENSQLFLPHHRAQELRSAIHGMRNLRQTLMVVDGRD